MVPTGISLAPSSRIPAVKPRTLAAPALAWLVLWFAGPLVLVAAASLSTRGQPITWSFSTAAWQELASPPVLRVILRTLALAAATTAGTILMGAPVAWLITRLPSRRANFLLGLVMLPLAANSLVLVYSWMGLLSRDGILGKLSTALGIAPASGQWLYTPTASLIGMVHYFLPFMVWPLMNSLEKLDARILDAAADLGASPRQTFFHIVLPLIRPGIAAGSILVFIQAAGTFVIPDLLGGSRDLLAGTMIYHRFAGQNLDWPGGAALSILVMSLLMGGLLIIRKLQRSSGT
jgi:spermidine/putrescine transport system permease protein